MSYEDPNAPSPTSSDHAKESNSPVDQSKSFLGGQHHPWRRLFARTADLHCRIFVVFSLGVRFRRDDAHAGGGLRKGN